MIGLARESIQTYISQHLQSTAFRLVDLGYEVNYRKLPPNARRKRRVPREVLDAQNAHFTQLRLTIIWPPTCVPDLLLEGSVRDEEGEQLKLLRLDDMSHFWNFAETDGQCPCGGRAMSERSARAVVNRARRMRVGNNVDMYRCPIWTELFHVTENPYPKRTRS